MKSMIINNPKFDHECLISYDNVTKPVGWDVNGAPCQG